MLSKPFSSILYLIASPSCQPSNKLTHIEPILASWFRRLSGNLKGPQSLLLCQGASPPRPPIFNFSEYDPLLTWYRFYFCVISKCTLCSSLKTQWLGSVHYFRGRKRNALEVYTIWGTENPRTWKCRLFPGLKTQAPGSVYCCLFSIGYWLLSFGYWLLAFDYGLWAIGYWLFHIGSWLLAIGDRLWETIGHQL